MSKLMGRFNKGYKFDVDLSGAEFVKLKDIYNGDESEQFYINGLFDFTANSRFGDNVCAHLTTGSLVTLPKHCADDVREMLQDDEIVKAINDAMVGFTIRKYTDTKYGRGELLTVEWFDDLD